GSLGLWSFAFKIGKLKNLKNKNCPGRPQKIYLVLLQHVLAPFSDYLLLASTPKHIPDIPRHRSTRTLYTSSAHRCLVSPKGRCGCTWMFSVFLTLTTQLQPLSKAVYWICCAHCDVYAGTGNGHIH
ncbi:unnamed protein product, partial [Pylaiella littoralis]